MFGIDVFFRPGAPTPVDEGGRGNVPARVRGQGGGTRQAKPGPSDGEGEGEGEGEADDPVETDCGGGEERLGIIDDA